MPPAIPLDGRITSLSTLDRVITGDEVMEIVSPGNAAEGNSYKVTTGVLAGYFSVPTLDAFSILANPTAAPADGISVSVGATFGFVGSTLQTAAITGDVTSSANSFVTTVVKVNGVSYGASPPVNSFPAVASDNTVIYRAIVGSDLPNPSPTTQGAVFSLPASANEVLSGIGNDGQPTRATTTGTGDVVRATNAAMLTTLTVTSTNAAAFAVGRLGATNPAFQVNCAAGTIINGFTATGAVASGVPTISASGGDTNVAFGFSSKGSASLLFYTRTTGSLGFQILDSGAVNDRWVTITGGTGGGNATLSATSGSIAVTAPLALTFALTTPSGGTGVNASTDVAATFINRALSVQNNGDTNDSSSGSGAYRAYNLSYTLPANFLVAGRALRITAHFRVTTGGTAPILDIQLKFGGTVVAHYQPGNAIASVTNRQFGLQWVIQGTAAPSASSATETVAFGNSNNVGSNTTGSDTAQPVNLATNGTLAITIESQWATAGVGTNQLKLSQFIVEAIN